MSEWIEFLHAPRERFAEKRAIMMADPSVTSGLMRPELRPMRVSFLRGRPGA